MHWRHLCDMICSLCRLIQLGIGICYFKYGQFTIITYLFYMPMLYKRAMNLHTRDIRVQNIKLINAIISCNTNGHEIKSCIFYTEVLNYYQTMKSNLSLINVASVVTKSNYI